MKLLIVLFTLSLSWNIATGQHDHATCGMTHADQEQLKAFVDHYNKIKNDPNYSVNRAEKLNVPIKFHAVAQSDGTGRINPSLILKQFERLRREFEAVDMNLYLYENRINELDNTTVYQNPGSAASAVRNQKDTDALNIFVTQNANTSSGMGTVLGFYSVNNDYIIIRITDVAGVTASLTHELGHMFSLPHTFNGWESVPYDEGVHGNPLTITSTPQSNRPIELVDGSNCETAADGICDTPPDYNFGFTASGCTFNKTIRDSNGDVIEPMIDNFMGYFIGCDSYQWTQGQIDVMRANWALNSYNGNNRSFLRSSYVPTTDTVNHDYNLIAPAAGSTTQYEDFVNFEWDAAEGATSYQLELTVITGPNPRKIFDVVDTNTYELTDLDQGSLVNWKVTPYNESYGGAPTRSATFTVGAGSVSTKDLATGFSKLQISPNPVISGNALNITFESEVNTPATILLLDITGKVSKSISRNIVQGSNSVSLETFDLVKGLHIIKIESEEGSIYKKAIVE